MVYIADRKEKITDSSDLNTGDNNIHNTATICLCQHLLFVAVNRRWLQKYNNVPSPFSLITVVNIPRITSELLHPIQIAVHTPITQ
jgi:hypothetical protein